MVPMNELSKTVEEISIPENHPDYPELWVSKCNTYRLIRCVDDIQWILQKYKTPKFHNKSYHMYYESLLSRWSQIGLPKVAPE